MSITKKIAIVCADCGSDDVLRDAWATWDLDLQEWVLGPVFDDGHCNQCEGEANLLEVDPADVKDGHYNDPDHDEDSNLRPGVDNV